MLNLPQCFVKECISREIMDNGKHAALLYAQDSIEIIVETKWGKRSFWVSKTISMQLVKLLVMLVKISLEIHTWKHQEWGALFALQHFSSWGEQLQHHHSPGWNYLHNTKTRGSFISLCLITKNSRAFPYWSIQIESNIIIPAVVVPSFLNTAFNFPRSAWVVLGRIPSSTEIVTGFSWPVLGSIICLK